MALGTGQLAMPDLGPKAVHQGQTHKRLIAGGGFGEAFIRYMATLTGKARPRLCYLPTASADSESGTIWKAQGIDEVLREAWNRGIVLGGASAGSLCWFEDNEVRRVVRTRKEANVYYVNLVRGRIVEERLEAEMIA